MAEPEMWSDTKALPFVPPPFRWVRWLIACLILLTLALLSHTSGRVARLTLINTRHWMTVSTEIPHGVPHSAKGLLSVLLPRTTVLKVPAVNGWLPPFSTAHLQEGFGWHGSGAKAEFESGVVLAVRPGSPVLAGVRGRVASISGHQIRLSVHGGYVVTLSPLTLQHVSAGQVILPTTRIGQVKSHSVSIWVTRNGYPLNPLSNTLYGNHWLTH